MDVSSKKPNLESQRPALPTISLENFSPSLAEAIQKDPTLLDKYNAKTLNTILQNLKKLLTFQVGRVFSEKAAGQPVSGKEISGKEVLSLFDKIFAAHFEGGVPLGEKVDKGVFRFLEKSEKSWSELFRRLSPFIVEKRGTVPEVKALVYRGLIKGAVVVDIQFMNGKTEKFVRLPVREEKILMEMQKLAPGSVMEAGEASAKWLAADFSYLALSHRMTDPQKIKEAGGWVSELYSKEKEGAGETGRRKASLGQGIVLSARTEEMLAEKFSLSVRSKDKEASEPVRPRESQERGGISPASENFFTKLFFWKKKRSRIAESLNEASTVFVGGYSYQPPRERRAWKGKPRWWVGFVYFIAASAIIIGLYAFLRAAL